MHVPIVLMHMVDDATTTAMAGFFGETTSQAAFLQPIMEASCAADREE
jgi:hypothetical protein